MTRKILLVEDDATAAEYIARGLSEAGYTVDTASDGRDGLFQATEGGHAAIILDRMLPGLNGVAVLSALRAADVKTPVIMLSALGSLDDRVTGLTHGADDYLPKPFAMSELLARLEAVQRRTSDSGAALVTTLGCADLTMDLLSRRVKRGETTIPIQPREFRLLEYLLRHKDQVVTRTMLLEGVWDYHFDPGTNIIDVHVSRLRKKVDEGFQPQLIHTVRGAGYRLSAGV